MRLVFGIDFDGGCWPGPLGECAAAAGEAWVGPLGLVDRLETLLGLGGPSAPAIERVAAIVPGLRARVGFWSRSAEADAVATARRLLDWRDRLALQGWRGEPVSDRLRALAEVTAGAPAGLPDRLAAIAATLASRRADAGLALASLVLAEPVDQHAPLWRDLVARLQERGVAIEALAATRATPTTSTTSGIDPRRVRLLRPPGPLAAAEDVAAWLAGEGVSSAGGEPRLVVIAPDATLDAALHRHGLPTVGAPGAPGLLAQVLPLALELLWEPIAPRAAAELLALPHSPVPPPLARRLGAALRHTPAVDGEEWRAALAEGLATFEDSARRGRVVARVAALFTPAAPRDRGAARCPSAEVERRVSLVESWLQGRLALAERGAAGDELAAAETGSAAEESLAAPLRDALERAAAFRSLLRATDAGARDGGLAAPEIRRLLAESAGGVAAPAPFAAEAGLARVGRAGGVAGPVDTVVWWRFTADSAERPRHLPLTAAERAGLETLGLAPPDPGREAVAQAGRWRRPLAMARQHALLVAPRAGDDGEPATPHPLWDELAAAHAGELRASRSRLAVAPSVPRRCPPLAAPPAPRRRFAGQSSERILPRRLSPTGLEQLLGCSFAWAIQKVARLEPQAALDLPGGAMLAGTLSHAVLERVLREPRLTASRARSLAARHFDEEVPRRAPELLLLGAESERAALRRSVIASAGELARQLEAAGRRVAGMEQELSGRVLGVELAGRADLVTDPPGIVDLKHSAGSHFRSRLAGGTALQLAAYARLLAGGDRGELPPVAYFLLPRQRLLTTDATAFPAGEPVAGPSPAETWRAGRRAFDRRREELARGELEAPANATPDEEPRDEESAVVDGVLIVGPPCRFCDQAALCGRAFAEEVS